MILDFIIIMGFALMVFLNVFLYKKKTRSGRFLIVIFSFIGIHLLNEYGDIHDYDVLLYLTDLLTEGGGYFMGPLIYYYVVSLLQHISIKESRFYYRFIPYILHFFLITLPVLHDGFGINSLVTYSDWLTAHWEQLYVVESLYFVWMIGLGFRKILQFEPRIKAFYSNITDKNLIWAKQMLLCLIAYHVVNLSISAWILLTGPLGFEEDYILTFNIIIICFYLGYNGLFQTQIFLPEFLIQESEPEQPRDPEIHLSQKTKTPSPTPLHKQEEDVELSNRLKHVFKEDKLFLNEHLTLRDLATALDVKEKVLSTHINQHLKLSFYELINAYRVDEFKQQISSNTQLTIMGVANQCGFKSKTSFYRIFKKATGQTPAQYHKDTLK